MAIKIFGFHNGMRLDNKKSFSLPELLRKGWQVAFTRGAVLEKPAEVQEVRFGDFTVRCNPERGRRLIPPEDSAAEITALHTSSSYPPCVFCTPKVLERQGVVTLETEIGIYHLLVNLRPVTAPHFLVVKDPGIDDAQLSQTICDKGTATDMAGIFSVFPPDLTLFFNSASGGQTASGASVKHFHVHLFPVHNPLAGRQFAPAAEIHVPGALIGSFPGWPAQHRVFKGRSAPSALYRYAAVLHAANNAYNCVFFQADGETTLILFPRRGGRPETMFRGYPAYPNHGGDAMIGSFLSESDPAAFAAMQEHPAEAEAVLARRLEEISQTPEKIAVFDRLFLESQK